ncbi:heterokaryon incompatibility protein-domain-containing protein [Xylariales sp. PMI_506]|nr:heterokaryon incompatibility protein-domain-containing protein [Xylariales sp. PMI_506]
MQASSSSALKDTFMMCGPKFDGSARYEVGRQDMGRAWTGSSMTLSATSFLRRLVPQGPLSTPFSAIQEHGLFSHAIMIPHANGVYETISCLPVYEALVTWEALAVIAPSPKCKAEVEKVGMLTNGSERCGSSGNQSKHYSVSKAVETRYSPDHEIPDAQILGNQPKVTMWLIDTSTLKLAFHANAPAQQYIILSHTWEDGEVSFQEFQDLATARDKRGFAKIETLCHLARKRGYRWAWVDTCCIDKTSSAELTENINAMFRYYASSAFCFAFLADLPCLTPEQQAEEENWWSDPDRSAHGYANFAAPSTAEYLPNCRWFSRGWTLQELIAPRYLEFYDFAWNFRGSKSNWKASLAEITGVDETVLAGDMPLEQLPVARKLSWAAGRQTSRLEDIAYSLFGIFGVYMPLLYGEGDNAFLRLQEEICKTTNDLSIFAWKSDIIPEQLFSGIFACSPDEFLHCRGLRGILPYDSAEKEFSITNQGVRFDCALTPSFVPVCVYEMDLKSTINSVFVGIRLAKIGHVFMRFRPSELIEKPDRAMYPGNTTVFYVRKVLDITKFPAHLVDNFLCNLEVFLDFNRDDFDLIGVEPERAWHPLQQTFCIPTYPNLWDQVSCCLWHLQVKKKGAGKVSTGSELLNHRDRCLVVCMFWAYDHRGQFKFPRGLPPISIHLLTQKSKIWTEVWNGVRDDRWRDFRYSPLLVNIKEQPTNFVTPMPEHIVDAITKALGSETHGIWDKPGFSLPLKPQDATLFSEDNTAQFVLRLAEPVVTEPVVDGFDSMPGRLSISLSIDEVIEEGISTQVSDSDETAAISDGSGTPSQALADVEGEESDRNSGVDIPVRSEKTEHNPPHSTLAAESL